MHFQLPIFQSLNIDESGQNNSVLDFSRLNLYYSRDKFKLKINQSKGFLKKSFGQLVLLGFDVTTFTPAAYQRRSLQRPS